MAALKPVEARYGALHNLGMAGVAVAMIAGAAVHFFTGSDRVPVQSLLNDPRFALVAMLTLAMAYYLFLGVTRFADRRPQVVIDRDGIALGFGRNRLLAWDDIQWVRLRRLALRQQLHIGLTPEAIIAADLKLSLWNLDDSLRPIRGMPATVLVRDNGLDTQAAAMLAAVRAFRPNLVKS